MANCNIIIIHKNNNYTTTHLNTLELSLEIRSNEKLKEWAELMSLSSTKRKEGKTWRGLSDSNWSLKSSDSMKTTRTLRVSDLFSHLFGRLSNTIHYYCNASTDQLQQCLSQLESFNVSSFRFKHLEVKY